MKSRWLFCRVFVPMAMVATLVACGGGGGGSGDSASTSIETPTAKTTLLVYMVGSNLESDGGAATADLREMVLGSPADTVNVIVETGGADVSDWRTVKRRKVTKNGYATLLDLGAQNMGAPETLRDFIQWGVATYPADSYHLLLWDHGSGASGFGNDEMWQDDTLSLSELGSALEQARSQTAVTFETIGFDACLMASIEVAKTVQPYGKHLVASEELEPGHGWNYTPIIGALSRNPLIGGATLGRTIADSYLTHANNENPHAATSVTLSVVDLSKIPAVEDAVNGLFAAIQPSLESGDLATIASVAESRNDSWRFGELDRPGRGDQGMVDLVHLATNLSAQYPAVGADVATAVQEAVVYQIAGARQTQANGLSIAWPLDNVPANFQQANPAGYASFVDIYAGIMAADITPPQFIATGFVGESFLADILGDDVANVYAMLSYLNPSSGTTILLGMDTADSRVPFPGGMEVGYGMQELWLTMQGQFVTVFVLQEAGDLYLLDIPVLLNGLPVDVLVWYDAASLSYHIWGAWPGYDGVMAERQILPIGPGDQIAPLWTVYDFLTDTFDTITGDTFTVGAGVVLDFAALPDGDYGLQFYAEDYAGNWSVSDPGLYKIGTPLPRVTSRVTSAAPITIPAEKLGRVIGQYRPLKGD